jgi:hypothetical protein
VFKEKKYRLPEKWTSLPEKGAYLLKMGRTGSKNRQLVQNLDAMDRTGRQPA